MSCRPYHNPITDDFDSTSQIICSAGGVHAKHNAGDAGDPARRKSMSAHPSSPDLAGQQPPDWLLRQREVASRGHSRLAQPPTRLDTSPASMASQRDGDKCLPSRPGDGTGAGVASSHEDSLQAPGAVVTSLTPFSAFAQHSQQTHSRSSSGSAESDPDRPRSGGMARKRSGSFGGRGAALGFMMEAQQQWRQDSFTKAAERRRNEQSSEPGRSSHSSLLSNSEQHAGQQQLLEAGVAPGAGNQPRFAKNKAADLKVEEHFSTAGTIFDPHGAAGPGKLENPASADTAGQAAQVSETKGSSQHPPVQSACDAQTLLAMQNPFLAAAQQWRETSSSDNTDQSQHSSDDSTAVPPEQPSCPGHVADAADSAAIAEQWLATRQELIEQSDRSDRPGGDQGSAHHSSAQEVPQSGRGQRRSHTAQQDSAQQDSESHIGVPFSSLQGPRRSMSAKAGPPPRKISFQKRPPAILPPGM